MFGLSVWEIFILLVVTLLIVGPERMPALARSAGEWVVKIRRFVANARAEMDSEFNTQDLKQLLNSQEQELESLRRLVEDSRKDVEDSGRSVLRAIDDARTDATEAGSDVSDQLSDALGSVESGARTGRSESTGKAPTSEPAPDSNAPAEKARPDEPAGGASATGGEDARRDDDDYEEILRQANDTFSRPFAPPEPAESASSEPASSGNSRSDEKAR
ncbi:MAG: twin-arginine translocase TatA/TatE family subunit [Halothiobacillaceae bacterium]